MRANRYVMGSTLVAALGGLLFGFDTAVISGTTQQLERVFKLTPFWLGFTVATALIGTIFGSLCAGRPGDRYGRKKVLIVIAALYTVSAVGCAVFRNWTALMIFRFIGGLGVGGSSVLSPMYIAEISPAAVRGRLVAVSQFNIVAGILLAFFSNTLIDRLVQADAWRWMFGVETLPALVFFLLLFFIPESPRWLVKTGREEEARKILARIEESGVEQQLADISDSLKMESEGAGENLFSGKYRKPLFLAVALALFNQLSGINVIMYYAPRIFETTGLASGTALMQSVVIGLTNLVFTVIAMATIDRFGRKTLLLTGSVGMALFHGLVGRAFQLQQFGGYAVLAYLVGFIAFFAFSQGAVIWVFLSEIFPNRIRSKGQSLGSFTHWMMAAVVSWLFPVVVKVSWIGEARAFFFFSLMMTGQLFFVLKWLPETKGKSLEKIQKELGIR
ncbi:sugar porter family MFS transporter [bacterium]|nr:sugar porter family MFS transporter [bacterium]